jgi:hypothetical protein
MRAKRVLAAGAALLCLSFDSYGGGANAGITNGTAAFGEAARPAFEPPMLASGHGASGGSIFWPYGVPYGPIYSHRGVRRHFIGTRHLRRRVKYR